MELDMIRMLAAAGCVSFGGLGVALGQGYVAAKAMEAISRNPAASDRLVPNMIIGMAICESVAIYSLVISLIILFVV